MKNPAINFAIICAIVMVGLTIRFCLTEENIHDSALELSQVELETKDSRPNIILINLDDADYDLLRPEMLERFYPNIKALAENSLHFSNLHVTTPLCGPSRACLMRGQYAFSTGVKCNIAGSTTSGGFTGGYTEFLARGHQKEELGVWMRRAGYKTIHIGKYHHTGFLQNYHVPEGWEEFNLSAGGRYYGASWFSNRENRDGVWKRDSADQYRTDHETELALNVLSNEPKEQRPFFLYLAPITPHVALRNLPVEEMVNREKYSHFAQGHEIRRDPDLYETDISDKPKELQVRQIKDDYKKYLSDLYIARVRAMKSIDEMIGRIRKRLAISGLQKSTYLMFTSDNGFQLGHHQLINKQSPFDRVSRVPLFVEGPNVETGTRAHHLLAHIDICPTILEIAGAPIPQIVEGKSFLPLLTKPHRFDESNWQTEIMIEGWGSIRHPSNGLINCTYAALRKPHEVFVSWSEGGEEYYDLHNDPFQLDNAIDRLSTNQKDDWMNRLKAFRKSHLQSTTFATKPEFAMRGNRLTIEGFAEDNESVTRVTICVQDMISKQYWNGSQWQYDCSNLDVELKAPNSPVSYWAYSTDLNTIRSNGVQHIRVTAIGFDRQGNAASTPQPLFVDLESEPRFDVARSGTSLKEKRKAAHEAFDSKQWQAAMALWQEISDAKPDNQTAQLYLGRAYLNLGELEKAKSAFEKVATHSPDAANTGLQSVQKAIRRIELQNRTRNRSN